MEFGVGKLFGGLMGIVLFEAMEWVTFVFYNAFASPETCV